MRGRLIVLATLAAALAGPAAAASSVTATVRVAGYPLVCGRPGGTLTVTLPARVEVPAAIAPALVRLNGAAAGAVSVRGHTVSVTAAAPKGVTCHSIVLARLTIAFAAGARLGGPAGSYAVVVRRGTSSYPATLTLSA